MSAIKKDKAIWWRAAPSGGNSQTTHITHSAAYPLEIEPAALTL